MNPETRQALKDKVSAIEDQIVQVQPKLEEARKIKDNAVLAFQNVQNKLDALREEKRKIKEDLGS
jgi:uncharacterized membrane protein